MTLEQRLRALIIDKAPESRLGRWFFNWLAEPYIAGHSLEDGIATVEKEYAKYGRLASLDVLGEGARTTEQAERYYEAYWTLISIIKRKGMEQYASLSLKSSAICAVAEDGYTLEESESKLVERLESLVSFAEESGVSVTLDMEDHHWTERTLRYAKDLWLQGKRNVGIVLQSRLNRTETDIEELFEETYPIPRQAMRIRACIGIYQVPEELGTNERDKAKVNLVRQVYQLFNAGAYVEIATHDPEFVRRIRRMIADKEFPSGRYEFQFLRGVQNGYALEKKLFEAGALVRYYAPVEITKGDGIQYMRRRLKKNPDFFLHGMRNTIQRYIPIVGKIIAAYI
ncbi:proline dehydrogenase family protein [Candidatus Woesearchaeota archaeon]|nr:proline dehydrogenase family protein [Candidatus Woesearchaeota archaeon]